MAYDLAMRRFNNSLALAKASFTVLRTDKQLAVIPVVSFVATAVTAAVLGGAVYLTFAQKEVINPGGLSRGATSTTLEPSPLTYVVGGVAYLAITFVVTFFTAALVAGAHQRLTGGAPTVGSAFGAAGRRVPQIFLWSMLTGTVGLVLQVIRSEAGWLGQIVTRAIGMAWEIVTWLAIPVIIAEGTGPIDSLKRAAGLFKRTWGENLIGQGALGVIGLLAALPGVVVGIGLGVVVPAVGVIVAVAWFVIVAIVMAALNGIYRTALYLYAAGEPVSWFDEQTLAAAFQPKVATR